MLAWLCFQHIICQGRHRHTLPIRLTSSRSFRPSCSNFSVSWSICPWKAMLTCQSTEVNKNQNMSRQLIQCATVKGSVFSYSRFVYFLAVLLPPLDNKALSVAAFKIKQLQSHWIAWACQSFPSCSRTASVTWGWQCPRFVTPMPGSSVIDGMSNWNRSQHKHVELERLQVHIFTNSSSAIFHSIFWCVQTLKNHRSCREVQVLLAIYGENPAALSSFQHLRSIKYKSRGFLSGILLIYSHFNYP